MNKCDSEYIRRKAYKIRAIRYLGGKCKECNIDDVNILEFHHIIDKKEDKLSNILMGRWSKVVEELQKCVLLCRNCHMETHSKSGCRRDILKEDLLKYKNVNGCQKCGYKGKNNGSLDFHHLRDKEFKVMIEVFRKKKIFDYILDEVDKCIVLCSNCHQKEHVKSKRFEEFEKKILEKSSETKEKQKLDHLKIKGMFENGMGKSQIAKELGCAKSSITYILGKK